MRSRLGWLAAWVLGSTACNAKTDSAAPPPAMSQPRAATDARGVPLRGLSSADRAALPAPPTDVGMPPNPKSPGPPGPKPAATTPPPAPPPTGQPTTGQPGGGSTEEPLED